MVFTMFTIFGVAPLALAGAGAAGSFIAKTTTAGSVGGPPGAVVGLLLGLAVVGVVAIVVYNSKVEQEVPKTEDTACETCPIKAAEEAEKQKAAEAAAGDKPKIHDGKQGKHVPGHNNFQEGKSELTHPDPQALVDKGAGTGVRTGNKEVVDFGDEVIGNWVSPDGTQKLPTSRGTIHYDSKGGAHIVPAHPTGVKPGS